MKNTIKKEYLDIRNPGSFSSLKNFLIHNPKYSNASHVRRELEDLETYTKFKKIASDRKRRKVLVTFPKEIVSFDLADLSKHSRFNKGYKWLAVFVDVFSRYVYLEKLKTKSASELATVFDNFFKTNKFKRLWTDGEAAVYSKTVLPILKSHGVVPYFTSSKLKALFSESAIKRIKMKMYRYFYFNKTQKWIDMVNNIAESINNTKLESLGFSPAEVTEENSSEVWNNIYKNYIQQRQDKPKFKVGDLVRISSAKGIFEKAYTANFTSEIFKVNQIHMTKPVTYSLVDLKGEEITGGFYDFELTRVISSEPKDHVSK